MGDEKVTIVGQVAEWLKAHAWRACGQQNCLVGSNPTLPACSGAKMGAVFLFGAWLSQVERCVRDAEVPGSNPGAPTGRPVSDGRPFLHPGAGDRRQGSATLSQPWLRVSS